MHEYTKSFWQYIGPNQSTRFSDLSSNLISTLSAETNQWTASVVVPSEGKKSFLLYFKERTFSVSLGFLCCTSFNLDIFEFRHLYDHGKITVISFICINVYTLQLDCSAFWYSGLLKVFILKVYYGDYLKQEWSAASILKIGKEPQVPWGTGYITHRKKPPKQGTDLTSPKTQANKPATRMFFPSHIKSGAFLYLLVPPCLCHCHK